MKILVIASLEESLLNFRGPLLRALVAAGCNVVCVAPPANSNGRERLQNIGITLRSIPLRRAGLNPLSDLQYYRSLRSLIRHEAPDVVLSYTIKPAIYGSLAAAHLGIKKRYALITGLGTAFNTSGWTGHILRQIASILYRRALNRCDLVFVQNRDIRRMFIDRRIVREEQRLITLSGSGVDLSEFAAMPYPAAGVPNFLFVGRLLADKGIREFVAAAANVAAVIPRARFTILGDSDANPTSVSGEEVAAWRRSGAVEFRGLVADVRPFLRDCTALVLPSYHEGLPRSILEAMAVGRAIITTDTIGCRDTVFDRRPDPGAHPPFVCGSNGILVPVKTVGALADAMIHLAERPALAAEMGKSGRELAEMHFDVRKINAAMLRHMEIPLQKS